MGCAAQKVEAAFLPEMKQGLSPSPAKGIAARKASVPIVGEEEGPGGEGRAEWCQSGGLSSDNVTLWQWVLNPSECQNHEKACSNTNSLFLIH